MVDYDSFSRTFAKSRQNLVWPEIDYILSLKKFNDPDLSILDVGCGSGRFLEFIEKKGLSPSYVGIDVSRGMIEESKKIYPGADFRVCDMQDVDTIKTTFDCIVSLASFHHLKTNSERISVLEKTKKVLKKDGIIAMTNWNLLGETLFSKYESVYCGQGDFNIKIGAHSRYYHGFTPLELQQLFEQTGYTIIENRVFSGGKNILSLLSKR